MITRGAAVILVVVLLGSIAVQSGCAASTNGGSAAPSSKATSGRSTSGTPPSAATAEPTSGDDRDIAFDGGSQLVSAAWSGTLAGADGFTEEPAQFGGNHAYRNDATKCETELIQFAGDPPKGKDVRAASDDGIRALSEALEPGSSDGIDQYIGDSRVPRSGGGTVAIRIAVAAWSDGSNAVIGARAFPEIHSMVLLVVTCPAGSSGRDEIQTLYRAGYFDLDISER